MLVAYAGSVYFLPDDPQRSIQNYVSIGGLVGIGFAYSTLLQPYLTKNGGNIPTGKAQLIFGIFAIAGVATGMYLAWL